MNKNQRHDPFIVANYKSLGPTKIATILGIPKGSVITRYGIITKRRVKSSVYASVECDNSQDYPTPYLRIRGISENE